MPLISIKLSIGQQSDTHKHTPDAIQLQVPPGHEVFNPTWRAHYDIHSTPQRRLLHIIKTKFLESLSCNRLRAFLLTVGTGVGMSVAQGGGHVSGTRWWAC